jgi:pyruvate dehydrogenase complex dehydrogenase (E1) component
VWREDPPLVSWNRCEYLIWAVDSTTELDVVATRGEVFSFSDTRRALRRHFGVDTSSIVLRVLGQLVDAGTLNPSVLGDARSTYGPPTPNRTGAPS